LRTSHDVKVHIQIYFATLKCQEFENFLLSSLSEIGMVQYNLVQQREGRCFSSLSEIGMVQYNLVQQREGRCFSSLSEIGMVQSSHPASLYPMVF